MRVWGHSVAYDALCADRVYVFFVDSIKEELTCVVGPDEEGWAMPLGRGIAGYVALTGEVSEASVHGRTDFADDRIELNGMLAGRQ